MVIFTGLDWTEQYVGPGGVTTGTTISSGGQQDINSGGIASGTIVSSGGALYVWSGGAAVQTIVGAGGTATIYGGTLDLIGGFAEAGTIVFGSGLATGPITEGRLLIEGTTMPTGTISGFVAGDAIDLAGVGYVSGGSVHLGMNNLLTVTEGGSSYSLQLDPSRPYGSAGFGLVPDSSGGTAILIDSTPPFEPQSTLPVAIGGVATITHSFLSSEDPDNPPAQLTYTVVDLPMHGRIFVSGAPATSFTQADIDNNRVQYRENGDIAAADAFGFTLSDPAGNRIGPEPFTIAIVNTTAPVIFVNKALSVVAGTPALIWKNFLCTVALDEEPEQLWYNVTTLPAHGVLLVGGVPSTGFSQADIDAGRVIYAAGGDGVDKDRFVFQVTDGAGTRTLPSAFDITIENGGQVACFRRGTPILTARGERPIESLRIGDRVVTLSGQLRPIKWIGQRAYEGRFVAGNRNVLPICIKRGAIGSKLPAHDLWVSPEHALYIDGMLVPARLLINGTTIRQAEGVEHLEYFHIELETHDIIIAAGLPAETYVECNNRVMFHNAAEFALLYPDDRRPAGSFCAPRLEAASLELAKFRA